MMKDRAAIFEKVTELMDEYCVNCFLKAHFRKEYGKTYAHSFCINKCTVGQQIKELGKNLRGTRKRVDRKFSNK